MKQGLLLLNLGTPDSPEPKDVGSYLNEFLMDPFVIDIPKPLRWILVKVLIVPLRKYKSSDAYKTVWTKEGSPLLRHLLNLTDEVRRELGLFWSVQPGMRYGNPNIVSGLKKLKDSGVTDLVVLPLYPQYAESSSRSSIEKVREELKVLGWTPKVKIIRSFQDDAGHIAAWVELLKSRTPGSHVLFSYHGLPERHLKKSDPSGTYCLDGGSATQAESKVRKYDCCLKAIETKCPATETCYRSQALHSTLLIVKELSLKDSEWSLGFQSRLGRTPWIRPYTDEVIPDLAKRGVKSLTVVTPSFVADCLETIEEIGDRAKEIFLEAGGENFERIECLNSRPTWVKAVANLAKNSTT